jgi:MoaA/NifB/PqqE/SkfB family radical SAM enzyme
MIKEAEGIDASEIRRYWLDVGLSLKNPETAGAVLQRSGRFFRKETGFSHLLTSPCRDIRPYFRIDADHTVFLGYMLDAAVRGVRPELPVPSDAELSDAAVDVLVVVTAAAPTWRHGLLLLARALMRRGDLDHAVGAARRAQQLSPNCHFGEQVLRDALRTYRDSGRDVDAVGLSVFERTLLRDFDGRYCERPFRNFEVDEVGDVHICCGALVGGAAIGNVHTLGFDEIWNSEIAGAFRRSCTDGSFRYCSRTCGMLMADSLPKSTAIPASYRERMDVGPQFINLKHDVTCNLWCASCRSGIIAATEEQRRRLDVVRDRVILPLLDDAVELRIAGGELFASKHYREIIERLSRATHPRLTLRIITNGVLLTEREWRRFPHLADMIGCIEVSVDAATEETYKQVRRGGNWAALLVNLEGIARRRSEGLFPEFQLNFVVQKANFREMPRFVEMARKLGARVRFDPIHNQMGAFIDEQYSVANVYQETHPEFSEFLKVLDDEILRGDDIWLIRPEPDKRRSASAPDATLFLTKSERQLKIIQAAQECIPVVDRAASGFLDGWFESLEDGTAHGWIWSPAFPDVRLPVCVWSDGALIAQGKADRSRNDLKKAGKGDGAYGFAVSLPWRRGGWRKEDVSVTVGWRAEFFKLVG